MLCLRKEFIWSHIVHRGELSRIQLWFSSTSHESPSILLCPRLSPEYTLCKQNPKDIFRPVAVLGKLGQIQILFKPKCGLALK